MMSTLVAEVWHIFAVLGDRRPHMQHRIMDRSPLAGAGNTHCPLESECSSFKHTYIIVVLDVSRQHSCQPAHTRMGEMIQRRDDLLYNISSSFFDGH